MLFLCFQTKKQLRFLKCVVAKLELNEGRVYGARYWTICPVPEWDVNGDWGGVDTWHKMEKWCVETFGPTPNNGVWTPGRRDAEVQGMTVAIKGDATLTEFLLKWS
jgi:hypothetical protein